ncbi:unnamed protein product [Effrenium voratum]|nr:unnamed protein product [Effrenium voratum]
MTRWTTSRRSAKGSLCGDEREEAQAALRVALRCLARGQVLPGKLRLSELGLRQGDSVTGLVRPTVITSSSRAAAFALVTCEGTVVSWGDAARGGDCGAYLDELRDVEEVAATSSAFAARRGDGRVVTWGDPSFGGSSQAVQHQLTEVRQLCGTAGAFAALTAGGRVVTWGMAACGGDSRRVQPRLVDVQQLFACGTAFAALLADGAVVAWGDARFGGNSAAVQSLRGVRSIAACDGAFAALCEDGSLSEAFSGRWARARLHPGLPRLVWGDFHSAVLQCAGDSSPERRWHPPRGVDQEWRRHRRRRLSGGRIVCGGRGLRPDLQEQHTVQECRAGLDALLTARGSASSYMLSQELPKAQKESSNVSYMPPLEPRRRVDPSTMEAAGARSLTRRFQKLRLENYRREVLDSIRRDVGPLAWKEPNAGRR